SKILLFCKNSKWSPFIQSQLEMYSGCLDERSPSQNALVKFLDRMSKNHAISEDNEEKDESDISTINKSEQKDVDFSSSSVKDEVPVQYSDAITNMTEGEFQEKVNQI